MNNYIVILRRLCPLWSDSGVLEGVSVSLFFLFKKELIMTAYEVEERL